MRQGENGGVIGTQAFVTNEWLLERLHFKGLSEQLQHVLGKLLWSSASVEHLLMLSARNGGK